MNQIYEKLKTLQDAINYEIDQHYINARGKKTTFSNFVIQSTKSLSFELNEKDKFKSLINLFYSYPAQDVTGRMYTIHKAQDILGEISKKYKVKKTSVETPRGVSTGASTVSQTYEKNIKKIDVKYVKGVGPRISQILNKLGVFSISDLLHYFPRAYIDYQKQLPIKDLKIDEEVTVFGTIKSTKSFSLPKRKNLMIFTITVYDSTGKINISKFI